MILSLLLMAATAAAGQSPADLPAAAAPEGGVPFRFSLEGERVAIWGGGPPIPRVYLRENLPALFSRTLVLDEPLPEGSALDWIFTGDEGGFTVRITLDRVRLTQRYYDSFGLSASRPPKARYPEKVWDESEAGYQAGLRTVSVTLDHQLGLILSLNGKQAARQTCLLEVRRHQLGWSPASGAKAGSVAGRMIEPPAQDARVTVSPASRHQSIYGFGGILSAPAYAQLSEEGKRRWWKLLAEYNLLVHREYPNGNRLKPDLSNFDRMEDATPHYYGDNFPNGEITDFDYIRRIRKLGGRVLFEFWALPPWAREKDNPRGAPMIAEYVRAIVGYCRISREKTGQPPDVAGVQNEIVQAPEVWHEMILKLREGLDRAGFGSVKIHMPDNGTLQGGIKTARAIQTSPAAWKAIDYTATHLYDFQQFFEKPDGYDERAREWKELTRGKVFLSTEFTVNNSAYQSRSYRTAFAQAQLYHKNMTMMDAAALIYCWTLLDVEQASFGATRSLFVPDRANGFVPVPSGYQLRTFAAFSRRLREGMVRVDADTGSTDLLASAYQGGKGERTLIVINRGVAPRPVRVEWPGARFTFAEVASQYQGNAVLGTVPAPLVIQPGEIVTLSNVALRRAPE